MNDQLENSFEHMESVLNVSKLKKDFNKDSLVGYIQHLRGRVEELEAYRIIAKRVGRDSIEIAGIPESINDKYLENKSLQILGSIGVDKVEPCQVHACHRLKNKRNTITNYFIQ